MRAGKTQVSGNTSISEGKTVDSPINAFFRGRRSSASCRSITDPKNEPDVDDQLSQLSSLGWCPL
jgi:hypothetical protein